MKRVIVISPHPDDEAIGCGGAIAAHVDHGDIVHVIFLTSGEKGGHGKSEAETIKIREDEAKAAAVILNVAGIDFWREPDGSFQASETNIARLVNTIEQFKTDVIYVPHYNEEHPDHKAAALLIKHSLITLNSTTEKPVVYMYEVWTPIQKIDYVEDISSYVEIKRKAIQAHKSQCEVMNFEEAILGLNRYRGEMHSWPGGNFAEVFVKMELEIKAL